MIKPSVGRVVLYRPLGNNDVEVNAAIVCHVHNDRMVNLAVFDVNGCHRSHTSVRLVQPGDDYPEGAFAEWMPYQVGQAAKTDELQKALDEAHGVAKS